MYTEIEIYNARELRDIFNTLVDSGKGDYYVMVNGNLVDNCGVRVSNSNKTVKIGHNG